MVLVRPGLDRGKGELLLLAYFGNVWRRVPYMYPFKHNAAFVLLLLPRHTRQGMCRHNEKCSRRPVNRKPAAAALVGLRGGIRREARRLESVPHARTVEFGLRTG